MEGYGSYGGGQRRGGFGSRSNDGGGDGFRRQSFSPVKVGDELDVTIEAVGEKGDGICKVKGFVLFVPSTKEGQQVKIRVTRVLRKVGFAEVVGEASASPASEAPKEEQASEEELVPEGEASEDFGEDDSGSCDSCSDDTKEPADQPPAPEDEEQ